VTLCRSETPASPDRLPLSEIFLNNVPHLEVSNSAPNTFPIWTRNHESPPEYSGFTDPLEPASPELFGTSPWTSHFPSGLLPGEDLPGLMDTGDRTSHYSTTFDPATFPSTSYYELPIGTPYNSPSREHSHGGHQNGSLLQRLSLSRLRTEITTAARTLCSLRDDLNAVESLILMREEMLASMNN